jgi:glycosyltransferase involved in cell wall biosynthesis
LGELKILFAIGSVEIGGAEKQMLALAARLVKRGWECHVFSLQGGGMLGPDLDALGIKHHVGGMKKGELSRATWKLIPALKRLFGLVCRLKPHVVQAYLPLVTLMGALVGRIHRIPMVITSKRGLGTHQERYAFLRPMDLLANRLSHRITVNSQAVWNDMIQRDHVDPSKLSLIYNGVDPSPFQKAGEARERMRRSLGVVPQKRLVIMIANFIPYKGHMDLIHASVQMVERYSDIQFILVGEDRGTQPDVVRAVEASGLSKCFIFLGQRRDIPQLMAASDLSVLPSYEEGFSNVILESMAAGLPVVATRVGGNQEAVQDGVTGWLVPPGDSRALAEKIIDLLSDPAKAKQWGDAGRRRVKALFSMNRMVEDHVNLYQEGLSARLKRPQA